MSIVYDTVRKRLDFFTNNQSGTTWTYRFSVPTDVVLPELRKTATAIEWRHSLDSVWRFLLPLYELQGERGEAGQAATITIGTVTTLPAGSQATVTNSGTSTDAVLNFGIPRGQDGTGAVTFPFAFPGQFSGDDASRLEQAIATGKTVWLDGNLSISRPVTLPKYRSGGLIIHGGFYRIKATTNFSGYLIGRAGPTSLNDAIQMMYPVAIYNLILEGFPNQTGLDVGAGYGHVYENIQCWNLKVGIHLKFSLQAQVNNLKAWFCEAGSVADWYQGLSWATLTNSQSNVTVYRSPRFYFNSPNAIGIAMYSCDGCSVYDLIIEGTTARHGVLFDAMGATNVRKLSLHGLHVECSQGLSAEAVRILCPGGYAEITDIIGHYPDMMVSAVSSGVLVVRVDNVGWWVKKNGKVFHNSNCGWVLSNLTEQIIQTSNLNSSLQSVFTGTVPTPTTGAVHGYNLFKYLY
jgi:hypothetical protein